ncbi:MAG: flagellar export protein FliJ [Syntrophobacterales bacterium]|nr:flagellar export protein FliJ [Syntrophobacterales bacterium]
MAFKFRYDNLLEYREKLLEQEQGELARMTQEAKAIEKEYLRLQTERFKYAEAFSMKQVEGISPEECKLFSENLEALEQRLLEEQMRLKKAMERLEEQRNKLIEMKKKVEMLKVLKEQEEKRYKKEESKQLQKTSDEFTVINWGRNFDEI